MPIHDQGYRRYGGERDAARAGVGRHRDGRHPHRSREARVPRPAAPRRGCRSSSAPCRSTPRRTCRRRRSSRRRPRRSGSSSTSRSIFVFFVTVYVGAGLIANDRRANALQIYLSKPLTARRVRLRQAGDPDDVPAAGHVGAGHRCCSIVQVRFAGNFTFLLRTNLFLFPAITLFSFVEVVMVSAAMLALSSLSNSSRYVGILYAALIFFSQALLRRPAGSSPATRACRGCRFARTCGRSATPSSACRCATTRRGPCRC